MQDNDRDAADVIRAYRRRRERIVPLILGGLAVILLIGGFILIVLWVTGPNPPSIPAIFDTDTPVPSQTPTQPPPTPTASPTLTPEPSLTPTRSEALSYVVEEGDSLFSIAESFGIELDVLIAANPDIDDAGIIQVGDELIIPPPGSELPTATALPETLIRGTLIEYTVLAGDTLESIAAQFNSTAEAIAEENEIEDPNTIGIGDILLVPVGIATPTITNTPDPNTPTATPRP
jgi:LysM repeat protein